ncbi:DUF3237 family protein [Brevibacillus fluminis]|uniref:UPF0311 protein EDM56_10985 n=1 Tax=Brevibacillus fluminis TaxID=511487 RepID=A0A3M8DQI5_9BACL|nr:DUF3237 family protein [Brevibacillus fluminis]RNB89695.1 DUF3237 family protein [Brevibacillus fluminis]
MAIGLQFSFEINVAIERAVVIGETPLGIQHMIPITGGTIDGPDLKGVVLPGGADWLVARPDGIEEVKAVYTIETVDGDKIYVENRGYYDGVSKADVIYFRTTPMFRACGEQNAWLNRTIMVAEAEVVAEDELIRLRFYKVT